jgi:hypothetical protein
MFPHNLPKSTPDPIADDSATNSPRGNESGTKGGATFPKMSKN